MPDLAHWSVFLAATIVLLLIPGPTVMYVIGRGIDQGYRGALFSAIGLALGDLLQVIWTAAGLGAVLASSVLLFTAVKYAGAAYLIFLGIRRLFEKNPAPSSSSTGDQRMGHRTSSRSFILQGFLALNPKTTLFFLALFPQFVSADAGPAWFQILLFGAAFVALGFVTNSLYGCLGGRVGSFARQSPRFQTAARYVNAATMISLGVMAALTPAPRKAAASYQ
jgi:threonine/homoserine/homoserine lactone efflux protein